MIIICDEVYCSNATFKTMMETGTRYLAYYVKLGSQGPGIRGTQVKSSSNKNWMSLSRKSDGANSSETLPSWHVRPRFSLIAIVNYYLFCKNQLFGKGP
jgi:hypothetical protein